MRLKQLHQLIHNATGDNINKASVEVHFQEIIDQEGEEYTPVERSDFSITRTVHASNTEKFI